MRKRIAAILACLIVCAGAGHAAVPQPMCTFYGQARDSFGWPYLADAEVILSVGGVEIDRCAIDGLLAPGVNFALRVPVDSGGSSYSGLAATNGAPVQIRLVVDGVEESVMQFASTPRVGAPGSMAYLAVTAGSDADGDGLPDDWEYWIADFSWYDAIIGLGDVNASDDFDGDGASNVREFLAGTDPAWVEDVFAAAEVGRISNGLLRVEIFTVPGKTYRVRFTDEITGGWTSIPFAVDPEGALTYEYIIGDGYYWDLYIDLQTDAQSIGFYQLTAE